MDKLTFTAEVKKVTSKKLVSLDMEYQAVLSSQDLALYSLGELPAESLLKVTVEVQHEQPTNISNMRITR